MLDINVGVALLTAAGSVAVVLWQGGRQVGKIETAVSRLSKLEEALKDVPLLRTDIEILKNLYERQHSDFRNLQNRFDKSQEDQIEIRVKMASQHDG
jgi:hypothetical protein